MIQKLDGYKTHITQILAIVIAVGSFAFGPLDVGAIHIPKLTFDELIQILQVGGGLSFIRMALDKKGGTPS